MPLAAYSAWSWSAPECDIRMDFNTERISEYIRIKKMIRTSIRIYSYEHLTRTNISKNILLRRVEFGIWLKHHRKIWNFTRRSRVKFQIFLWCLKAKFQIPLSAEGCLLLTPRHLWNLTKICGVWAKFSQILKICENLAQTPQILVKFHRFWVVISGGEWCY